MMLILLAAALRRPLGWQWPSPEPGRWWLASLPRTPSSARLIQHVWYRYRTGDPLDVMRTGSVSQRCGAGSGDCAARVPQRLPRARRIVSEQRGGQQPRGTVAGDLLVASIMLADGVFNQTVVLILDADEDGALGVILNEISQTPLDAVLPEWVSTVSEPRLLFHGGPVSPNGAICLASVAADGEEPPGWRPLFEASVCCTWTPRSRSSPGHTATCGSLPATPAGLRASCRPRSLKACGTWFRRTIATSLVTNLSSCGVRCCVARKASSRTSQPGWRIPELN